PRSPDVASGTIPAATAAAEPPLLPPGVWAGFHGLRVTPQARDMVAESMPNSDGAVFPIGTAPAARKRATCGESSVFGGDPLKISEPWLVGIPAQSSRSLTPKGTPARGPGSSPFLMRASISAAIRFAPSQSM